MQPDENYEAINRHSWNNRVDVHLKSEFYDLKNFIQGKSSLNPIELDLLGDLKGKSTLHLQCHFGQDTISLSRLGAQVTGVDFSDKAIDQAIQLAQQTQSDASFICCNVYDLPQHLNHQFDIVFTSYGVIGWLPDLNRWGSIISKFLKPGGTFILVEFHPVVWMFDDNFENIAYRYFNSGALFESENGTYADKTAAISQEYVMWNHSMAEVMNSLIDNQLEINALSEYDYSPYPCFNKTIECAPRQFRIQHFDNKIPMVFSVVATKKNNR